MAPRAAAVAALILSTLVLTSCATPVETGIVAKVVTTPTAAPGEAELPPGVTVKAVVNNGRGTYLQTSIADGNPAMKYSPERADDAAKAKYTPEQLQDAQKFVVRFIAEEALDSTINGGGDAEAWWSVHEELFHPDAQAPIYADLIAGKNVIQRELWQQEKYHGTYDYIYGASQSRISARSIRPFSIETAKVGELDALRFYIDVTCQMNVTPKVGTVGSGKQYTVGPMIYDVALDSLDRWRIAGYENGTNTVEG
jgi:hypothetical protein